MDLKPSRENAGRARRGPRLRALRNAGSKHSSTSVLLPEPLMPVTTTNRCNGIDTVRFFKLFRETFPSVSQEFPGAVDDFFARPPVRARAIGRGPPRAGYFFFERRHLPVTESWWRSSSASEPWATTRPP